MTAVLPPLFSLCFSVQETLGQNKLFEHFTKREGLPSMRVYGAQQGTDGNIWFALSSGICSFNGLSFTTYPLEKKIKGEECTGLIKDRSGLLWCYTSEGHIYRQEGGRFILAGNEAAALASQIINSLQIDSRSEIWAGTVIPGGLYRMGKQSGKQNLENIDGCSFYVKQIEENAYIWGSYPGGVANNKLRVLISDSPYTIALSQKSAYSKSCFLALDNGDYLYAKDYELLLFNNRQLLSRAFVEHNVQAMIEDSEGKIWIGLYQGGVICFPDSRISGNAYNTYLGGKTVTGICEDNAGNIWFTTLGDGIYYLPSRSVLAYRPPQVYSSTNEKTVKDITHSSISGTELHISAASDFRVINTDTARYDSIPPTIYIAGVRINGRDTLVRERYDLPHYMNFITISYVGFALSNPNILHYRYTMKGLNVTPTYTNQQSVQYTTLPPGHYRFEVSAMNKNGYWSQTPAVIEFIIHPPYWETWWFRIIASLCGLLLILSVMYLWMRSVRKKERERSMVKKRMADLELQALKAQMNPHFIFNTMSSIQHLITTGQKESALKYLSRLAQLMRMVMENSAKARVSVKDECNALEHYLQLESLRFKDKFSYRLVIDENVDAQYDSIPAMLIQPYVENAILHGFAEPGKKGELSIRIAKNEGGLRCIIEDNGIGRQKAEKNKRRAKMFKKSRGMSITAERLEILNEINNSPLSVRIMDLTDERNRAAGTRVEIFIPSEKQ
ncbi:MAG: sensor histidine kinase [Flavobacteriales bacterium]